MAMLGYHHPDYKRNTRGCNVHFPYYHSLKDVAKFEARPDDVAICGFPKSGTVWVCSVVGLILHDADPSFLLDGPPLERKVPFLEYCTPLLQKGYRGVDTLEQTTGRRLFFSHLNCDLLPPSLLTSGAKIIYKTRNPKDSLISLHYHHMARPASDYHWVLGQMVDDYSEDTVPFGPYFDHVASFWKHRENPNIFFTSYEALHKNHKKTVQDFAKFLNQPLSDEQIDTIVRLTTFAAMKENPVVNRIDKVAAGIFNFNVAPFMRKGIPGGYADDLTQPQIQKLDNWIALNKKREDLRGMTSLQDY
ncbi:putative Sulfotransferase family cytosolic 1B member 1 [Hypsibius exemplaris]|uniref:Sulfotransferase family cytosolic 1B member 1 n=1 Tax=Hypsibius exemplaris TaxID=2072580 RepID=A0A1W0XDR3_HYPEX|nr:putative Sulfotransferase family cytosolic 1B member 1 [Hypsibius exemplaris]